MRIFSILLLISLAVARRLPRQILFGKCYDFQTAVGLDVSRWTTGKWYETQRYFNNFEKRASCSSQTFFLNEEKKEIDITYSMIHNNNTRILQGRANYTALTNELDWEATFPEDTTTSSFDVVATDYDKYAIVYSCVVTSKDPSLPEKEERVWVLSRTPTMEEDTKLIVKEALQINGTDLTRYFDQVDQNDCP